MNALEHVDAAFEERYGFCRKDCPECDRLDEELLAQAKTPKQRAEIVANGIEAALTALADEGT